MRIVIPGGTGHVGRPLAAALRAKGHDVVVLSRREDLAQSIVGWNGRTLGPWAADLDGADAVINLAGRSVNCRYTPANRREMMDSRVESTRVIGAAIAQSRRPPRVWLQMSTATIYAHRYDAPNDEAGPIGCGDGAPKEWGFSIEIARNWEREQDAATTPGTRKVALRTAMVMLAEPGGVFEVLSRLSRFGLGGPIAGGAQFMSWIHGADFIRAVEFLLQDESIAGPVNLAAPNPLPQRDFMRALREAWGVPLGLPATKWMLEIGTLLLRTESELVLKSRRVVSSRLREHGFTFDFSEWPAAAEDLVRRWRTRTASGGQTPALDARTTCG